MLIQQLPKTLRLSYQIDHADLSGQFTAHWGNEIFTLPEPFSSVQVASARHDDGWRCWDANPKIDLASGRPIDFMHLAVREHTALNRKGIADVTALDLYAGLLVNMHGCGLYNGRYGTSDIPGLERYSAQELPVVQTFLAEHETKQQVLKAQLRNARHVQEDVLERQLWTNYQLLQVWDRLSLYFYLHDLAKASPLVLDSVPRDYMGNIAKIQIIPQASNIVTLSPYPFASSPITFTLVVRDIPDRKYVSDSDLQEAFQLAPPQKLSFQVMTC